MHRAPDPAFKPLLDALLQGLAAAMDADGWLRDPLSGQRAPSDHYAQTSAALAWLLAGEPARARQLITAWCACPPRACGHAPFNRLMLLLARTEAERAGYAWLDAACARRAWRRSRLARRYPSNNWMLLAALCRLLEARAPSDQARTLEHFCTLLGRWSTPLGGFIDYPARPAPRTPIATPTTYHHKALFLTTLALWQTGSDRLNAPLMALLRWVRLHWDGEHGLAGGLGRSTHALFGDVCLLSALHLITAAGVAEAVPMRDALAARLLRQQRPDGLLWLNPAGALAPQQGWDAYMHLLVYNAWSAALLAWSAQAARDTSRCAGLGAAARAFEGEAPCADPEAGVRRLDSHSGLRLWFVTRGQAPQGLAHRSVELRYAGGRPFHACLGERLLCPPAIRLPLEDLLRHPALAGWTPLLRLGDRVYGLDGGAHWTLTEDAGGVRLGGLADARALTRQPARDPGARLLGALDWRLLGGAWGRREVLARARLPEVEARLKWRVAHRAPVLALRLSLINGGREPLIYLNPAGHAFIEPPCEARWVWLSASLRRRGRFAPSEALAFPSALPHASAQALAPCRIAPGERISWVLHLRWPAR
ncbi:MAG: hypothetical protein JXM75_00275 [Chromatiaceae bacterium]|nr:hypothetical protein [Chromatiaceae bacterium]